MESTGPAPVYQDFEPSMVWVPEDNADTLHVYLPGFAKEQLRVQLRARNLIISGERKLQQNTWSRFRVEFAVSVNCDLNKISAKFEGNKLIVRQPKLITPTPKPQVEGEVKKPAAVVAPVLPTPQKPMDASNEVQKTLPETKPNIQNKEERKDQAEVPKMMGLEEKRGKDTESKTAEGVNEIASDKKTSDRDDKNKKAIMDASSEVQKTLPETKPNIENKEERKDQAEVPKMMGPEEKRGKDTESKTAEGVNENAPDKKTSDWDDKNKKAIMDASNEVQKTLPKTKPNIENKEERKDQAEVPKMMGLEQKRGKDTESKTAEGVNENAPDKKTSDCDDKNKKAMYSELDKTTKTALDNYKRAVGVFATKLKTSRNAVNMIVILLVGIVIGMYVSNSFKSCTKA